MEVLLNEEHRELDQEWILLIQTAKMMGLSVEEVKLYITNSLALAQRTTLHNTDCSQEQNELKVLANT